MAEEALRMEHIVKVYPNGVMANKDVTLAVNKGEIHALSGENGAGKSTLMKILFGEEQPTRGTIYINGRKVHITSPAVAIQHGIGMVHQHFMLMESLSALDNIILGIEPRKGLMIDRKRAEREVLELSRKYNMQIDPRARVGDLTVGQKQKIEILKTLLRGAKILIMDEPTAVLTPQETHELFVELKNLKEAGYTIIFISHKLEEVCEICDRITIIRRGETMGVHSICDVTQEDISRLMVGRDVALSLEKAPPKPGEVTIRVRNLVVRGNEGNNAVDGISFSARAGEIIGVAGVEGNGQSQLVEALTGLRSYQGGSIQLLGKEIAGWSIRRIRSQKVSHIPEDRMSIGVAPNLSITENMLADKAEDIRFSSRFGLMKQASIRAYGGDMVEQYGIFTKSPDVPIGSLSGGNIQKVVLARELSSDPQIIIADQPTRGVDVGASEFIRQTLIHMRDARRTIFLVSSDLNEVIGLSDRLMVLFEGKITAFFSEMDQVTEELLGRYMLGIDRQTTEEVEMAFYE